MAEKQIGALDVAATLTDADLFVVSQSGTAKQATLAQVLAKAVLEDDELSTTQVFSGLANGTELFAYSNRRIGTVIGADVAMSAGSCTLTFQIADDDGSNATAITGMTSLAVTTTKAEATATAANIMAKSGSTDRQLLILIADLVGTGKLYINLRYKVS